MDAFYASCEELRHPELRGRPLIVGADPKEGRGRGVVVAANYPARALGVRTAMSIRQAWERAPSAAYVWPEHSFYSEMGRRIFDDLARDFQIQRASIDEAFVDATPHTAWAEAESFAARLHERVARTSGGLSCSVGVGANRLVAKIASGHRKPNGTTLVPRERVQAFLDPLPAREIPFIGPKTSARLAELDIHTVQQLREWPRDALVRSFGAHGAYMHEAAHGRDESPVLGSRDRAHSMSHEHTFDEDTRSRGRILSNLRWMMDALEDQLEREAVAYRTVAIKMRYADFATLTRQASLPRPTQDVMPARVLVPKILRPMLEDARAVRLVGLRLSTAERDPRQLSLRDFHLEGVSVAT